MKDIEFSFEDAIVPQHVISETAERLRPEIKNMATAISEGYESDLASLYLPDDRLMLGKVRASHRRESATEAGLPHCRGHWRQQSRNDSCSGSCSWKAVQSIDGGYKGVICRHS